MRVPAADALQFDTPARTAKAWHAEILAGAGRDPPAGDGGGAFGRLFGFGRAPENKGGDARSLGGELEPLRGGRAVFGDFADHTAKPGMAQTFFHREQHVRIATRLDIDHPVGVQSCKMERGGEQVAPAQAPQDRPFGAREDAGEKDRCARIVGKIRTARDLV